MENELLKLGLQQGIWALLSVFLIFYILKSQDRRDEKQEEREKNYQLIIKQITDRLQTIDIVKADVEAIKEFIVKNNKKN